MNPLVVTGAVAFGRELLDRLGQRDTASSSNSFSDALDKAQASSPITPSNGMPRVALDASRIDLGRQLLAHPSISEFVSNGTRPGPLELTVDNNGICTLHRVDGQCLQLDPESEAGKLAARISELNGILHPNPLQRWIV